MIQLWKIALRYFGKCSTLTSAGLRQADLQWMVAEGDHLRECILLMLCPSGSTAPILSSWRWPKVSGMKFGPGLAGAVLEARRCAFISSIQAVLQFHTGRGSSSPKHSLVGKKELRGEAEGENPAFAKLRGKKNSRKNVSKHRVWIMHELIIIFSVLVSLLSARFCNTSSVIL